MAVDKSAAEPQMAGAAYPQKAETLNTSAPANPPPVQGYPYPANEYAQQPPPAHQYGQPPPYTTPAYNVPYNTASSAQHSYGSCGDCFNMQWALFIAGWFFFFPSLIAVVLPTCDRGRLGRDPSYRMGWIGNLTLCTLWVILIVLASVMGSRATRTGAYSGNPNYYYYG